MSITALPSPPSTNDPANFATKADALLAALPDFVDEANAVAVAMNLNSTTDTSASSVAIGTGAKSFTVSTGKSFQPGMWLVIADTAAPSTNQMYGTVTSYDTGTGALVMNIASVRGSGTKIAWVISQSAPGGAALGANSDISSLVGLTSSLIYSGTKQNTTSGTSVEFLSIPSWARRITISLSGVSTNGTAEPLIQIGDSGGYETSGYLGSSSRLNDGSLPAIINFTAGIGINSANAANTLHGSIVLTLLDPATNLWAASGTIGISSATTVISTGSSKALSATLDRLRITTFVGVDTFDAGSINILYE